MIFFQVIEGTPNEKRIHNLTDQITQHSNPGHLPDKKTVLTVHLSHHKRFLESFSFHFDNIFRSEIQMLQILNEDLMLGMNTVRMQHEQILL